MFRLQESLMDYREFNDPDSWAEAGAAVLLESAIAYWNLGKTPIFCLAGGGTPMPVYRCFAGKIHARAASGANSANGNGHGKAGEILVLPGDERWMPEDPRWQNETMLAEVLTQTVPIITIASWLPDLKGTVSQEKQQGPIQACSIMNTSLSELQSSRDRLFACTVLGLGADGHTAGLFRETQRGIHTAVYAAENFPHNRVSLLPETLKNSEKTLVLVHKRGKEEAVAAMLRGNALINTCMSNDTKIFCLV